MKQSCCDAKAKSLSSRDGESMKLGSLHARSNESAQGTGSSLSIRSGFPGRAVVISAIQIFTSRALPVGIQSAGARFILQAKIVGKLILIR